MSRAHDADDNTMEVTMGDKFPRIAHVPSSPGGTRDDKRMASVGGLLNVPLVITEKIDGSNTCLCRDAVYARSHNGPPRHPSFDPLKALHAGLRHQIPEGYELFGEWTYATHSIAYNRLPAYFLAIGLRYPDLADGTPAWASWNDTVRFCERLGLCTVPLIDRGFAESAERFGALCDEWATAAPLCGPDKEGFVVRRADGFPDTVFADSIGKYVRVNHVQTDEHWSHGAFRINGLATEGD